MITTLKYVILGNLAISVSMGKVATLFALFVLGGGSATHRGARLRADYGDGLAPSF
jgi:hypothetical protein